MALATRPQMLLLDEPMAGFGIEESAAQGHTARQVQGAYTILLIEHDMDAVFKLADRVSVLVCGRIMASGSPDYIRASPDVRAAYLGEQDEEAAEAAISRSEA